MLQTIYEADTSISAEWRRRRRRSLDSHSAAAAAPSGSEVLLAEDGTEVATLDWNGDSDEWEKQLQRELLLIQRQQQIQKQLLISEFQKQHQNLLRQHQAQLQEHVKLQQALMSLRQQQDVLVEQEREDVQEEREVNRRDAVKHYRRKERAKEGAMASTEVRQKLHDFLMSKSTKDLSMSTMGFSLSQSKLWCSSTQQGSEEQSSPPLGETPPTFKYPLTSGLDYREHFPLRKTASEPNLKVRSRLKQKVSERRSGPIRRRDGSVLVTPLKKRTIELTDSSANESPAGSGPNSPIGQYGIEPLASSLSSTTSFQRCLSQGVVLQPEGSVSLLNLYTSPSLPNLTLALHPAHIRTGTALKDRPATQPVSLEGKVSNGQQALLQHLLLKEQRQQRMSSPVSGSVSVLSSSPLVVKERTAASCRIRTPRHRPLNRTQSAPLPQSGLVQLVLQQQHHDFLEKQKQLQQHIQDLSQSTEELRKRKEEEDVTSPPAGVIRSHCFRSSQGVIRVKREAQESDGKNREGDEREKDTCEERNGGGEMRQRSAEHCLENMTETDV